MKGGTTVPVRSVIVAHSSPHPSPSFASYCINDQIFFRWKIGPGAFQLIPPWYRLLTAHFLHYPRACLACQLHRLPDVPPVDGFLFQIAHCICSTESVPGKSGISNREQYLAGFDMDI